MMDMESALHKVGGFKRWNMVMATLLCYSLIWTTCFHGLAIVYIGWEPPHHCTVAADRALNESIPLVESGDGSSLVLSSCSRYKNGTYNETEDCQDGWTFETEGSTIVSEWDLVCDNNYMSEMSQLLFQAAALMSEIISSHLMDRVGRKYIHIVSHVACAVFGTAAAFSPNFICFTILRCLVSFFGVATLNSGVTILLEFFDNKWRVIVGIGLEFHWVVSYMLFALFGYFIAQWRHLQLVASVFSLVWLMYIWILPESPVWLAANKRYTEAEEILKRIAKANKVSVPNLTLSRDEEVKIPLTKSGEEEFKAPPSRDRKDDPAAVNVFDLVTNNKLRLHTIICSLGWLANNTVYYGLTLSTPSLAGNRHVNFVLMGLVELPAYTASILLVRYSRKIPLCVFHVIAGVPLAIAYFIPKQAGDVDLTPLVIFAALLGKFGITGSFAIIVLYTRELFPTNVRGTGGGFCNILGRVGSMAAPFVAYAAKSIPWLPNVIFGGISIGVSLVVLLLPDTAHTSLPQTLRDIENMHKKVKDENQDNTRKL